MKRLRKHIDKMASAGGLGQFYAQFGADYEMDVNRLRFRLVDLKGI